MLRKWIAFCAVAIAVPSLGACVATNQELVSQQIAQTDGLSAETAFKVRNVRQEYEIAAALGYDVKSQALSMQGGKAYDILSVVDPETGAEKQLWFDISSFFGKF